MNYLGLFTKNHKELKRHKVHTTQQNNLLAVVVWLSPVAESDSQAKRASCELNKFILCISI